MTTPHFREFELTFVSILARPVVEVPLRWGDLYLSCFRRFERFAVKPSDLRFESQSSHPSDFLLACYVLEYTVAVRYRIGSVELWTKNAKVTQNVELGISLIEAALGALRDIVPDVAVQRHTVTTMGHFDVPGDSMAVRLNHYITNIPEGAPQLAPEGVAFRVDHGDGAPVVIRFELSARYPEPNCGFIRVDSEYPGTTSERDAGTQTTTVFQEALERFGFQPK